MSTWRPDRYDVGVFLSYLIPIALITAVLGAFGWFVWEHQRLPWGSGELWNWLFGWG